jgi:hypothetical protein
VAVTWTDADGEPREGVFIRRRVFSSLAEASAFFRAGSTGYSVTSTPGRLDGIELRLPAWRMEPLQVEEVYSSYFADEARFPPGSVAFDCALLMRDLAHEWHAAADLRV